MAYICGCNLENGCVRLYLERRWKINHDYLIWLGNRDPRDWAKDAGLMTINQAVESERYLFSENNLKLVCLFQEL